MCSWDKQENAHYSQTVTPQFNQSVITDHHTFELINENKQLWTELKKKNELTIALRDDIYYKQRQLIDLERYKEELEQHKNNEECLELIREINKLKKDLREKQILINFLNEMVEKLCDEVLQTEHVEFMETEIVALETQNKQLINENSEIKVRLKIVEHDNDKLRSRFNQLEEDNQNLKRKLDKTTKKLKQKENSILSFKKFTELVNNLQSRISRSKSENHILRNVIERVKNVANNYENLECENQGLKETVREFEMKTEKLKEKVNSLQEAQLKMKENETTTKPALMSENADLKQRLRKYEDKIETLTSTNSKLKKNLKIYEKILIENKAYIQEQENRVNNINTVTEENERLKTTIDKLNEVLNREHTEKQRIINENLQLQAENERLSNMLEEVKLSEQNLAENVLAMKQNFRGAEKRIEDLRRQLQIYENKSRYNVEGIKR